VLGGQDAAIAQQYNAVRGKLDADAAKSLTADQRYFLSVRDRVYAEPFSGSTPFKEIATSMDHRLRFLNWWFAKCRPPVSKTMVSVRLFAA